MVYEIEVDRSGEVHFFGEKLGRMDYPERDVARLLLHFASPASLLVIRRPDRCPTCQWIGVLAKRGDPPSRTAVPSPSVRNPETTTGPDWVRKLLEAPQPRKPSHRRPVAAISRAEGIIGPEAGKSRQWASLGL
jgi:hypothetical protein